MNIFYLDRDPVQAARYHCNIHLHKMIVESCQLMSTAHWVLDNVQVGYKASYINHPCALWVRESWDNYSYLYRLTQSLFDERERRGYLKPHASRLLMPRLCRFPKNIAIKDLTPPARAFGFWSDKIPSNIGVVEAYRCYYMLAKRGFADWSNKLTGEQYIPDWWDKPVGSTVNVVA